MERLPGRLFVEWLVVAALAYASVAGLAYGGLIGRLDNILYDVALVARPALPVDDVAIVAIDQPSLAALGRWPWQRSVHAALLDRLAAAGARAIGYDVLFVESTGEDAALARSIRRAGNVLLPVAFVIPGSSGRSFDLERPPAPIAGAARALGQAAVPFDADAVVRRAPLIAGNARDYWPHLAEQLYRVAAGAPSPAWRRLSPRPPTSTGFTAAAPVLIPFGGAAGRFPTVSFVDVLRGQVLPETFRGKVVLVGSTASGSGDLYPVPSRGAGLAMPGVEILANTFEALAHDRLVRPAGAAAQILLTTLPLACLLTGFLLWPPRLNLLLGAVLMAALLSISLLAMRVAGLWLAPAGGLVALLIAYPLWAWRRLEAASVYMTRELDRLATEPDELSRQRISAPARGPLADRVMRQTALLQSAIGRVRDLRRFFAESLRALPDPTLLLDGDGRLLVANEAARRLFAIGGEDVGATPATLDTLMARIDAPLDPADGDEIGVGDGRTFALGIAPLGGADGRSGGSIVRLTDISAIRLAIRQREDALELLSHDMRAPQASILALLDVGGDAATVRDRIAAHARRTLALADEFVQLARAESAPYADDLLDLESLLIDAADGQWALARARGVTVETGGEGERLVRGDRSLLTRALANLLDNAVKHSAPGGTIRCSIAGEAAQIVCTIADDGPGVPPDLIATIFERYRTTGGAGGAERGGAGLGLAFVATVVARHGGTIACANRPEGGALFTLTLPAAAESS